MKKTLLSLLIFSVGALNFATLHRTADRNQVARVPLEIECKTAARRLTELNAAVTALQNEISAKKSRIEQMSRDTSDDSRLLLAPETKELTSEELAMLRRELGIEWDTSDDYVLVSKKVLKQLNFTRLSAGGATATACSVFAISPDEQSGIRRALQELRDLVFATVQRTEPSGEIVAQYTIPATDAKWDHSLSNNFSGAITAVLGTQRTDLLLDSGWRQIISKLGVAHRQPMTMTIRRSVVDGEQRLFCECKQGDTISSLEEIRYATYPSCFCLALFPGGWDEIAEREGFELPKDFRK